MLVLFDVMLIFATYKGERISVYTGLSEEQVRYFKNRFYAPAKMIAVDGKPTIVFDLLAR